MNKLCACCGREIKAGSRGRKYCSMECRELVEKSRTQRPFQIKVCPVCGKRFKTSKSLKIYDSIECGDIAAKNRRAKRAAETKEIKKAAPAQKECFCAECGKKLGIKEYNSYHKCKACRTKKRKPKESISDVLVRAAEARVSYGKYVAMQRMKNHA